MRSNLTKYLLGTCPVAAALLLAGTLTACGDDAADAYEEEIIIDPTVFTPEFAADIWAQYLPAADFSEEPETVPTDTTEAYYDDFYQTWLADEATRDVVITFDGETATVDWQAEGKKTKEAVKITTNGAHVVIRNERITDGLADGRARMNYILRGSTDNGSLRIYSNKKFMLTLDNVSITNAVGSAINAQKSFEKKRMFLHLPEGTVNTLCDATEYTDTIAGEDEKGALFSEGKLIVSGTGTLRVTGNRGHAIAADDRIRLHSGINLEVLSAAKDGIHGKDAIVVTGGRVKIYAEKDAMQGNDDPLVLNKGIYLCGGLLYTCGTRAFTAESWQLNGAQVCAIYRDNAEPTLSLPYEVKKEADYSILYTK